MRILVADDELPARQRLARLIEDIGEPQMQLAGTAVNGREALIFCQQQPVDVVLMDIRMPEMDGLQAAVQISQQVSPPPAIIFVSAYDEYALRAFRASAVDYLLKPVRRETLLESLQRASASNRAQLQAIAAQADVSAGADQVCGSFRGARLREPLASVLYFQAEQKYVLAYTRDKQLLMDDTLKSLERRFAGKLLRIHRNTLVNRAQVSGFMRQHGQLLVLLKDSDCQLEVSRRHQAELREWVEK